MKVGSALSSWLRDTLHDVEPWMSGHEIHAGSRWGHDLAAVLEESNFGVLCLTPENLNSSWLLFEAGSLAKTASIARVVPYLLGLSPSDIGYPLAQFQGVQANRHGTQHLLKSINAARPTPLEKDRLGKAFTKWWPDLDKQLKSIPPADGVPPPVRPEREILEEVLDLLRAREADRQLDGERSSPPSPPSAPQEQDRATSFHLGHSRLSKAEAYTVKRLKEGVEAGSLVNELENQGMRRRLALDMVRQIQRDVEE